MVKASVEVSASIHGVQASLYFASDLDSRGETLPGVCRLWSSRELGDDLGTNLLFDCGAQAAAAVLDETCSWRRAIPGCHFAWPSTDGSTSESFNPGEQFADIPRNLARPLADAKCLATITPSHDVTGSLRIAVCRAWHSDGADSVLFVPLAKRLANGRRPSLDGSQN